MPKAHQSKKEAGSPRFTTLGSAVCATVTAWKQTKKSEVNCITVQLDETVTLMFYNKRSVRMTDIQSCEIAELTALLIKTFRLRLVRKLEVIENGAVRKIEVVIQRE